ncbi:phosphoribosylglycinamide synthetase phosphoribosylamine-glycine ligase [Candidatus Nitrospira nitrosa]|uniref:Phosphoribosylamine--glycine ligase n=1 Tax=Candidatus Nitrospira nitrosa TaxID=1742972 RepID=A0A0S4LB84_9BACT|nr:phosphoribosylamine--glycine ligase [Candidatus Nitrospira nitrosa]CUS34805.1 phosphoribosylglycinamide synthetase phosphoribosylamine-glycine ligase [Candidatus Nitrospira nitrosa]
MKVLVVGSGGREHAMVWKLAQSPRKPIVYCAPGNAGIASLATCVPIKADDLSGLKQFVTHEQIDLTVVGPEVPLALGIVDEFRKAKLRVFGPTKQAARLEASKIFSKDVMAQAKIRTAQARSFEKAADAMAYLERHDVPVVIKADGLAQGKGVIIATTHEQAKQAVRDCMETEVFGLAGKQVLIEQFLDGEELTIMAFTDGKTIVPMPPAQDHKRVGNGDAGLNTGGMGAYCPAPLGTASLRDQVLHEVLQPMIDAMARIGSPFQGVLYAGLMIVKGIPYVLEFNARMGDPETQVVLPLLKTDLLDVIDAVIDHRLEQLPVEWSREAAVCVVMTSGGYPGSYQQGMVIAGLPATAAASSASVVFHAGTALRDKDIITAGGRVLGVLGLGSTLSEAQREAYRVVNTISFEGCHFRTDIAHRALRG